MGIYRYVGGDMSVIHGVDGKYVELKEFGQKVELTDKQAKLDLGNRVPLLTEPEYDGVGPTDAEIADAAKGKASADFGNKRDAAVALFVAKIQALYGGPVATQEASHEASKAAATVGKPAVAPSAVALPSAPAKAAAEPTEVKANG